MTDYDPVNDGCIPAGILGYRHSFNEMTGKCVWCSRIEAEYNKDVEAYYD